MLFETVTRAQASDPAMSSDIDMNGSDAYPFVPSIMSTATEENRANLSLILLKVTTDFETIQVAWLYQ